MFKISLSGQMFDELSVWEHLEAAASAGYDAVDLRSTHVTPDADKEYLESIKKYCQKYDLKINALSCFVGNYALLGDEECEREFELFKKYVELACFFDADMVRMFLGWQESRLSTPQANARAIKWAQRSGDYARDFGKKAAVEIHHGTLCDTHEACKWMMEQIDHDHVGLIVDPVNLYQVPVHDVPALIRDLQKYICGVHVKDIIKLPSGAYPFAFKYDFYKEHTEKYTTVIAPSEEREEYYSHRRINQGGVDWYAILEALKDIGYEGYLSVESVAETNILMPQGRMQAFACYDDLTALMKMEPKKKPWDFVSPEAEGMHVVISPEKNNSNITNMLRLNLSKGKSYTLNSADREMNVVLISGIAAVEINGDSYSMGSMDSFYIPGKHEVPIAAKEDCSFYIASAVCEGYGEAFFHRFDLTTPFGIWHQIHGKNAYARECLFTLPPEVPASRLICGLTWSGEGGWTSWPPHQHEKDLEEAYCYFNTKRGFQLSYTESGNISGINFYPVTDGHMFLIKKGYHPTVSLPDAKNMYLWVMTAYSHEQRRYDLASNDPAVDNA